MPRHDHEAGQAGRQPVPEAEAKAGGPPAAGAPGAATGLGDTGLAVHPLCLGGNVFGWTVEERAGRALLDHYTGSGGNFIDTADVYPAWAPGRHGGESEEMIGRWMAARRNRDGIVLATKAGRLPSCPGLGRANLRRAVEGSLSRLRTDRIDLLYAHADDIATPMPETFAAFAELIAEGKVRRIAASNYTPGRLTKALTREGTGAGARFSVLQAHYNLMERHQFEARLRPVCRQYSLPVLACFPLAAGFLTGKYTGADADTTSPRAGAVAKYRTGRGAAVVAALRTVAARHGCSPAAVALAWLMHRPQVAGVVASARTPGQLTALLRFSGIRLAPEEVAELSAAGQHPVPPR